MNISVLGSGTWGIALARVLSLNGSRASIRSENVIRCASGNAETADPIRAPSSRVATTRSGETAASSGMSPPPSSLVPSSPAAAPGITPSRRRRRKLSIARL